MTLLQPSDFVISDIMLDLFTYLLTYLLMPPLYSFIDDPVVHLFDRDNKAALVE